MTYPDPDDDELRDLRDPHRVPRAFARAAIASIFLWAVIVWAVGGLAGCWISRHG